VKAVTVSTSFASVQTSANDDRSGYDLTFEDGRRERYDAVIIAATADKTARLLDGLDQNLSGELSKIDYASSAVVVSGHRLADIRHPLDSFGLVIPHVERRKILAVSFSSRKFSDRAPEGRVLLRTFVGGAMQPEVLEQSNEELIQMTCRELDEIFGVRSEPEFARVVRHNRAMAQYHVGHLDRVAKIDALVGRYRGLALAGNAYRGVGLPDVIASGEQAAKAAFSAVAESHCGIRTVAPG
jgi:oxygen-dependent protoporphyrinogen oxidase